MGKHITPARRADDQGRGLVPRPYVIGITGPIACGKSTVMKLLAKHGAVTIDADLVYRDLVKPGKPLLAAIVERFGSEVLSADGELDRRALGRIVFSDPAALADLDHLTHPVISDEIERRLDKLDASLVAIEAVKLSQAGVGRLCDETWLVTCGRDAQLSRLMTRNGFSGEEAERRINAQITYEPDNFSQVIRNDSNLDTLGERVERLLARAAGYSSTNAT